MPSLDDIDKLQGMCFRKKAMGAVAAQHVAARFGQRAYCCPVCQNWHCSKLSETQFVDTMAYTPQADKILETKEKSHKGIRNALYNKISLLTDPLTLESIATLMQLQIPPKHKPFTIKWCDWVRNQLVNCVNWSTQPSKIIDQIYRILDIRPQAV